MKKNLFLMRLLSVGLFWSLFSTSMTAGIEAVCGSVASAPTTTQLTHYGGRYITSQGTVTAFVLFVRFSDDNETSSTWPNASVLPSWASNILNPTYKADGSYTTNSLSHYIWENSYGKLHIIGDVYYVTLPYPESHYYGLITDEYHIDDARYQIQHDALNTFEAQINDLGVDMSKYDNWKNTGAFNNVYTGPGSGQTKDNNVDLCWIAMRNLHDENYSYGIGEDIALLYASKTINGVTVQSGYPGSGISCFSHNFVDQIGYNTVIKMPLSEYDNDGAHCTIIGTMVHELTHYFFGYNHFGQPNNSAHVGTNRSSSNMMSYDANNSGVFGNFLGYEKIRLGWITSSEIQTITSDNLSVTLNDMETTTSGYKIVKVPLGDGQNIFIENRAWKSVYEARYSPANFGKSLKPGILAYLIPWEDDYLSNTPIQQICANGKWDWNLVAGGNATSPSGYYGYVSSADVVVKVTPDASAGYDEREDIHVATKTNALWWALYYPNTYGSTFGRWYKGENYIDENHNVGDYRGNDLQLFDVGYVISPYSNGSTDKWNSSTQTFVATTVGIEVSSYNSSTSSFTLKVVLSNPKNLSPSKPQNLRITNTSAGPIQLAWNANTEPDLSSYEVWRNDLTLQTGWQSIATTTSTSYTDQDYIWASTWGNDQLQYKIRAKDSTNNLSVYSDIASTTAEPNFKAPLGEQQAIEQVASEVPTETALLSNYPNPFNPTTNVRFTIHDAGFTTLKVYDVLGREVATLLSEVKNPGTYDVHFDGSSLTSGMYFVRLTVQEKVFTQRISLMK